MFCMTKQCPRIGMCHVFKVIFCSHFIHSDSTFIKHIVCVHVCADGSSNSDHHIIKQRWFKWLIILRANKARTNKQIQKTKQKKFEETIMKPWSEKKQQSPAFHLKFGGVWMRYFPIRCLIYDHKWSPFSEWPQQQMPYRIFRLWNEASYVAFARSYVVD